MLFPRNVSSIPRLLQKLSKEKNKNLWLRKVFVFLLFLALKLVLSTWFTSFSAFLWMLSYLSQLKLSYNFHFLLFSLLIFAILNTFLDINHLVLFITKLWDGNLLLVIAFLLLRLFKFRYLCFLKTFFVYEKTLFFSFL